MDDWEEVNVDSSDSPNGAGLSSAAVDFETVLVDTEHSELTSNLKAQLDEVKSLLRRTQTELEAARDADSAKERLLASREEEIENLCKQVAKFDEERGATTQEGRLREAELQNEVDVLRGELREATSLIEEQKEALHRAEAVVVGLKRELQDNKVALDGVEMERSTLVAERNRIDQLARTLRGELSILEEAQRSTGARTSRFKMELDDARSLVDEMTKDLGALRRDKADIEAVLNLTSKEATAQVAEMEAAHAAQLACLSQQDSTPKISYLNFAPSDRVLFFPTTTGLYVAFSADGQGPRHFYLSRTAEEALNVQKTKPQWLVLEIVEIRPGVATQDDNPFNLALGTKFAELNGSRVS